MIEKDSNGKGITRWFVGGAVIIAIILLLLWKCNGKGQQDAQPSPAMSHIATEGATPDAASHPAEPVAEQPAASASSASPSASTASTVPTPSTVPTASAVGTTPTSPNNPINPNNPTKPSDTTQKNIVFNKEEQQSVGEPTQEELESLNMVQGTAPSAESGESLSESASGADASVATATEEASVVPPVPATAASQPAAPVPTAAPVPAASAAVPEKAINRDSLRQALADSLRQAMLAELQPKEEAPGYNGIALRTNLLYDAALIPTIGAEFDLGKLWSIGFDYNGTWFYSPSRHRYWQTIGGYLMLRRYLKADDEGRPFMGHHVGVYGQLLTFDIEFGDRGWQGAYPNWGGGIEYGYSAWLSDRLNIDFSLGIGYLRLKYKDYDPDGDSFKWRSTHRRNWFGPTKAEVSLKWLLYKRKKHQKANQK